MSKNDSAFSRLKNIARANVHEVLDKLTRANSEKMLNQWVRDAWGVVHKGQSDMIEANQKVKECNYQISELEGEADHYHDSARVALEKEDKGTAKAALSKENDAREDIMALEAARSDFQGLADELEVYVAKAEVKVKEVEREAERLKLGLRVATTQSDVAEMSAKVTTTDFSQTKEEVRKLTRQKKARAEVLSEMEADDVDSKIDEYARAARFDPEKALEELEAEAS